MSRLDDAQQRHETAKAEVARIKLKLEDARKVLADAQVLRAERAAALVMGHTMAKEDGAHARDAVSRASEVVIGLEHALKTAEREAAEAGANVATAQHDLHEEHLDRLAAQAPKTMEDLERAYCDLSLALHNAKFLVKELADGGREDAQDLRRWLSALDRDRANFTRRIGERRGITFTGDRWWTVEVSTATAN